MPQGIQRGETWFYRAVKVLLKYAVFFIYIMGLYFTMSKVSEKRFTLTVPIEIFSILVERSKETKQSRNEVVRQLILEGLLSEKINEVHDRFDDAIEKISKIPQSPDSDSELKITMLTSILMNVCQTLSILRKGMSDNEINYHRKLAEEFAKGIKGGV